MQNNNSERAVVTARPESLEPFACPCDQAGYSAHDQSGRTAEPPGAAPTRPHPDAVPDLPVRLARGGSVSCGCGWRGAVGEGDRRRAGGGLFAGGGRGAARGAGGVLAAAFSRARKEPSSAMVVMRGAGKTTVVFLSTPISTRDCRLRSWRAGGGAIM